MEYPCDECVWNEEERLARENGPDLEYVGLLRKCMYGTPDARARWQAHHAQILKRHGFVPGLSNPVQVERDVRLLVHGDDFMVQMPTRDEKRLVLDIRWNVRGAVPLGWQHFDANFVCVPCDQMGPRSWQADTRHVAMVLRDLGLEKSYDSCGPASEVGRISTTGRGEILERRGYHVPDSSFAAGSLARGMKKVPRQKTSRNSNVLDATCGGDQLEQSCLNHEPCVEVWKYSATQTTLETWERENPDSEWQSCGEHI